MWSRNQRQTAVRLLFKRAGLLALLFLVIFAANAVWEVYNKERDSRASRLLAEIEKQDLIVRQQQLEEDITRLRSDRGLEETLREQYSLAKAGEGLIIIIDPPNTAPAEATSTVLEKLRSFFWFW